MMWLDQFARLFEELLNARNLFKGMGIDFEEKAFYDILKAVAEKHWFKYPHEKLIVLSKDVKIIVEAKAKYTDWIHRDDIKAELPGRSGMNTAIPRVKDEVYKENLE